ncbi:MAG: dipicolinate synthase subunit B [Candidatus Epulonipiscioides saccharophilum]|nr:MAG: dipicolinate synthase subunit B [Epulopiscium sp. AS2M-Bin001]
MIQSLEDIKLGLSICGSFFAFQRIIQMIEILIELKVDIYPIMSYSAYDILKRLGKEEKFIEQIEELTGKEIISDISEVERVCPDIHIDAMLIAPCTGNTLSKLVRKINDTPVTIAINTALNNYKPVIIAVSTNENLGVNLSNIGELIKNQSIYFVPFFKNNPDNKSYSLISDISLVPQTIISALNQKQLQPMVKN